MDGHKYKNKVLKRTFKRCMITVIIIAISGIIAGLFYRWLFLVALFAFIPIIYLVNRVFMIIKWNLVEGIIEDVTLTNDYDQPYTEAHIIFKTKDNIEHECLFTIGHYGDYEEGIEPELDNMLQSDKELFIKKHGFTKDLKKIYEYIIKGVTIKPFFQVVATDDEYEDSYSILGSEDGQEALKSLIEMLE